jgi:hypothetical protein
VATRKICPQCREVETEGLILCWKCHSAKFHAEYPLDFHAICKCGVHLGSSQFHCTDCKIKIIDKVAEKEKAKRVEEESHTCYCGKEIPVGINKCYQCARRQGTLSDPITPEQYHKLEHLVNPAECVVDWNEKWQEAFLRNKIDIALLTGNKAEFFEFSQLLNDLLKEESA